MAYKIIGFVHQIQPTKTTTTANGQPFHRRSITLLQRRFNPNTGEEYEPNYPTLEFSGERCLQLDQFPPGTHVQITFEAVGVKYNDKTTGEEKYFNSLRAFRIEAYAQPQTYAPVATTHAPTPVQTAPPPPNPAYPPAPQTAPQQAVQTSFLAPQPQPMEGHPAPDVEIKGDNLPF